MSNVKEVKIPYSCYFAEKNANHLRNKNRSLSFLFLLKQKNIELNGTEVPVIVNAIGENDITKFTYSILFDGVDYGTNKDFLGRPIDIIGDIELYSYDRGASISEIKLPIIKNMDGYNYDFIEFYDGVPLLIVDNNSDRKNYFKFPYYNLISINETINKIIYCYHRDSIKNIKREYIQNMVLDTIGSFYCCKRELKNINNFILSDIYNTLLNDFLKITLNIKSTGSFPEREDGITIGDLFL